YEPIDSNMMMIRKRGVLYMNWTNWSKKERILAGSLAIVIILLVITSYQMLSAPEENEDALSWEDASASHIDEGEGNSTQQPGEAETIVVDVKGAVKNPGVYEVDNDQRVVDIIEEAGGFLKKANEKQINLAQRLTD